MVEEKGKQAEERQDEPRLWRPWRPPRRRMGWRVLWRVLWAVGMVVALLTTALLIVRRHPELALRNLTPIAIGVSVTAIIIVLLAIRMGWRVLRAVGMVVAVLTTGLLIVNLHPEIWKGLLEERNLTLIAIGVSVTTIIVLLAIGGAASSWTGFRGKTVWDLLQLLIVPLALAVIGLWFATQQDARQQQFENQRAEAERKLVQQRAQDEALQAYLDQMNNLLLEHKLRDSKEDSEVRTLARARTLTVLGRLDSERNSAILQFLREAQLISGTAPVVRLSKSNLSGADLRDANLNGIHLSGANLSEADLSAANLSSAEVSGANLTRAHLIRAHLSKTDLSDAGLYRAHLIDADLRSANLSGAHLNEAHLSGANLSEANLRYADLRGADLSYADLSYADLSGADLSEANVRGHLIDADLSDADLSGANLSRADLGKANLRYADLRGADLSGAYKMNSDRSNRKLVANEELDRQAYTLKGATMPNGQKYEDWLKDKEGRK